MKKIRKDSSFKGAFGRSLTRTLYANQKSPESERNIICNDVVSTIPVVILLQKDSHLLDAFHEKIEILNAAGLIEFWKYRHEEHRESEKQPELLTIEQLLGCFYIWIFGNSVSLLVFFYEMLKKFKQTRKMF